jgi:hypothetical protein
MIFDFFVLTFKATGLGDPFIGETELRPDSPERSALSKSIA